MLLAYMTNDEKDFKLLVARSGWIKDNLISRQSCWESSSKEGTKWSIDI